MKIFIKYIFSRIKIILCFLLFCVIFLVTFYLYNISTFAMIYGAAISAFFGMIIMAGDFIKFRRRHKILEELRHSILFSLEKLPEPETFLESDYTELIRILYDSKRRFSDSADEQFRELVDYYTVWAHQIKTPIAAMRLNLQNEDTPQKDELLEELQRIEQYVEMVLCYLRLDSETNDFVLKKYALDDIVKQAVKKFSMLFIRKKISLKYTDTDIKVLTDEKWLLFVVEQILSNALKYTRSGSISIYTEEPEILCIEDTGIGIAPSDIPLIFEKGYTGCNGRSDKKASGIGLYLCKRICIMIGHKISVSSQLGKGTTVRIYLHSQKIEFE